jgi:hypothetical protein
MAERITGKLCFMQHIRRPECKNTNPYLAGIAPNALSVSWCEYAPLPPAAGPSRYGLDNVYFRTSDTPDKIERIVVGIAVMATTK